MKRQIFENLKVQPYTSAALIDREGFLSGLLGVKVAAPTGSPTAAKLTLTITECDTSDGSFAAVADKAVINGKTLDASGAAEYEVDKTATTGGLSETIPLDFVGCKRYVKITGAVSFTGGTSPAAAATYALALGDPREAPVD